MVLPEPERALDRDAAPASPRLGGLEAEVAQLRRALADADARFDELLAHIPAVVWIFDPARNVKEYVSPAFERVWGRTRAALLADPQGLLATVHPDDRERVARTLHEELRSGFDHEYRIVRPDGAERWIHDRAFVARRGGEVHRIVGIAADVTERKRAEEALRHSEDRFRAIFDNAAVGIARVGLDGRFLHANQRLCAMLGYAPAELLGKTFHELTVADDLPKNLDLLRRALAGGLSSYRMEKRYVRKDGSVLWAELDVGIVRDAAAVPRYLVSVVVDISERKRLAAQLLQAQKLESLGRLAGGVAHDFNNLLTVILASLEQADAAATAGGTGAAPLASIRTAAERAAGLTQQLLAFARMQITTPRVVDVNDLLAETQRMLDRLIGEHIELEARAGLGPLLALVDPVQLQQVLLNLAVNARDAMPGGGRLEIRSAARTFDGSEPPPAPELTEGDWVCLTVQDTGAGMSEEAKARAFEPFFTTKAVGQGTGMGLATCYGIVKQAGGHITLWSAKGQGTRVEVFLPRVECPAPARPEHPAPAPGGHEVVLVVEDEGLLRQVTVDALRRRGYRVLEATSSAHALTVVQSRAEPIDLMVTDVVMPGMGGPELAAAVRAVRPGIAVLFMSGYTADAILRQGIREAGVAFLPKPFRGEQLARKVREVLDAR